MPEIYRPQVGETVAIDKGPSRPYEVLAIKGNRAIVNDGFTKAQSLPFSNVRKWEDVLDYSHLPRLNFGTIDKRNFAKEQAERRALCITFSYDEPSSPLISLSYSSDFERIFPPEDIFHLDIDNMGFRLHSVDEAATPILLDLKQQALTSNEDILRQWYLSFSEAQATLGEEMSEMVRSQGIHSYEIRQDKEVLTGIFDRPYDIERDMEGPQSYLNTRGWNMYDSKEGHIVLVVHQGNEYQAIDFNQLLERKPNFVREKIRQFYVWETVKSHLNSALYNLELHKIDFSQVTPKVVEALAQRHDTADWDQLRFVLEWLSASEPTVAKSIEHHAYQLAHNLGQKYIRSPHGYLLYTDQTLHHALLCPSVLIDVQMEAYYRLHAHRRLLGVLGEIGSGKGIEYDMSDICHYPLDYMPQHTEKLGQELREHRKETEDFQKFVEQVPETDIDDLFSLIKKRQPKLYAKLRAFRQAFGEQEFNEIIHETARSGVSGYGETSFESAKDTLQKNLASRIDTKWGYTTGSDYSSRRGSLYDDRLEELILVIAIRRAQEYAATKRYIIKDDRSEKVDRIKAIYGELQSSLQKEIDDHTIRLQENAARKKKYSRLVTRLHADETSLSQLLETARIAGDELGLNWDPGDFRILFNLWYLVKTHKLKPDSEEVLIVLKTIFPDVTFPAELIFE